MGRCWPPPSHASQADWFSKEDRVCEWASLLLAAFKWVLLVVWPARLPCEWIATVGGVGREETRGDSPFSTPPHQAEAKVRLGLESWWPSFWLVAIISLPLLCLGSASARIKF